MPRGRSNIELQTLLNAGLNPFAVELLAESINGHRQKEKLRTPFSFLYDDVIFTLSLCPDREWNPALLLEIFEPISNITELDTYLIRFARAFVMADEDERPYLTHIALMLIEKYSLWPYVPPPAATERKEPPPIVITPTATPSSCLAEDYEQARRDGVHVRVIENGVLLIGQCWCGKEHQCLPEHGRDIYVATTRPAEEV